MKSVAGKTFPAFPAHGQPAFCPSGKKSMQFTWEFWSKGTVSFIVLYLTRGHIAKLSKINIIRELKNQVHIPVWQRYYKLGKSHVLFVCVIAPNLYIKSDSILQLQDGQSVVNKLWLIASIMFPCSLLQIQRDDPYRMVFLYVLFQDDANVIFDMLFFLHGPLTKYVILRAGRALGKPGTFSPPPRVSDPDMHRGTCVTHVPWSLTSVSFEVVGGENVPGIPGGWATPNFPIW